MDQILGDHLGPNSPPLNAFPASMPPELSKAIAELIATREFNSLEEINAALAHLSRDHNTRGNPELNGLSPEQVRELIYTDWQAENVPMRLTGQLSIEALGESRFFQNARAVLSWALEEKGVKATSAGCFNRKFVTHMLGQGSWPEGFVDDVYRYNKVVNEQDVFPLHVLRVVLELAGLLRKSKGILTTTKRGRSLLSDDTASVLFRELFVTYFRKLNLSYLGRLPEVPMIQNTIAYSFYGVSKMPGEWVTPEKVAPRLFLPKVREEIALSMPSDYAIELFAHAQIFRPLEEFGFLRCREAGKDSNRISRTEYTKAPLFDAFIRFDFRADPD